jgi:Transposase
MGMDAPTIVSIPVYCAPKTAPCPTCGKKGRRKRRLPPRLVRTVAFKKIAYLKITCGEYQARCECCKTFRSTPEGVLPRALYDNKVRELVLDRILKDGMNIEQTMESLRREFLLDLSTGFVYDVLRDSAKELDMAEHRRKVLEQFSGTLCVDEIHLGALTMLLATDPLSNFPVAFALVAANDQDHMLRFLKNLKNWGLMPRVVITDDSSLYPAVLAELWSDAAHQLCVFHIIKNINKLILDAVRRLRAAMSRQGNKGPKKKRGRKTKGAKTARRRRGLSLKEKAKFVFMHRYLIVKRRENFNESDHDDLRRILEYLPELKTLRRFADQIYWLSDTPKNFDQAATRRGTIVSDPEFQAVPELVKAMEQLAEEKFAKLMAYLNNPVSHRVRTNNHVERTNRMVRFFEKVRYKWRRRKTLVRFVVLKLDEIWSRWSPPKADRGPQRKAPRASIACLITPHRPTGNPEKRSWKAPRASIACMVIASAA